MLRLFRLKLSKKSELPSSWYGGTALPTSPPTAGSSILITSAPRSASCIVPKGPAPNCSSERTRRSCERLHDDLQPGRAGARRTASASRAGRLVDHGAVVERRRPRRCRRPRRACRGRRGVRELLGSVGEKISLHGLDLAGVDDPLAHEAEQAGAARRVAQAVGIRGSPRTGRRSAGGRRHGRRRRSASARSATGRPGIRDRAPRSKRCATPERGGVVTRAEHERLQAVG